MPCAASHAAPAASPATSNKQRSLRSRRIGQQLLRANLASPPPKSPPPLPGLRKPSAYPPTRPTRSGTYFVTSSHLRCRRSPVVFANGLTPNPPPSSTETAIPSARPGLPPSPSRHGTPHPRIHRCHRAPPFDDALELFTLELVRLPPPSVPDLNENPHPRRLRILYPRPRRRRSLRRP